MGTVYRDVPCSQVETFNPEDFHRRPKRPVSWQYVDRSDGVTPAFGYAYHGENEQSFYNASSIEPA